eukprot:567686-Amorphochlora_amoeboformis.AAC.1
MSCSAHDILGVHKVSRFAIVFIVVLVKVSAFDNRQNSGEKGNELHLVLSDNPPGIQAVGVAVRASRDHEL